jgi:hypothetical protein
MRSACGVFREWMAQGAAPPFPNWLSVKAAIGNGDISPIPSSNSLAHSKACTASSSSSAQMSHSLSSPCSRRGAGLFRRLSSTRYFKEQVVVREGPPKQQLKSCFPAAVEVVVVAAFPAHLLFGGSFPS